MNTIKGKTELEHISARLCGEMVDFDIETRHQAAQDAKTVLAELPKFLSNSPHCRGEIQAMKTLIARVCALNKWEKK